MSKGVVIPVDLYDKDGNMIGIEFNRRSGEFVIEAGWDQRDEQNSENRIAFRKWAYHMLEQMGYEILK
jgi:hypothetical protein